VLRDLFHPKVQKRRREARNPLTPTILLQSVALKRISSQPALQSVAIGYALSLTSRMGGAGCLSQSDAFSRYRFTPTIHFPRVFFARACYGSRKNCDTVPKTVPVSKVTWKRVLGSGRAPLGMLLSN
jgi:hypothetical protein